MTGGVNSGVLKRLTITACNIDKSGTITLSSDEKDQFTVMMNPKGYEHNYKILYNKDKGQGRAAAEPKYSGTNPDKISFDIWIDGTGVVSDANLNEAIQDVKDVKTQISELQNVAYKYIGVDHEPRVVRLLWGSMIFYGRLESMKAAYKLFKPSGDPLRALVTLTFTGFVSKVEESLKAKRSSPDLTHVIEVKAGDTLPLLCNKIYKDCSYYLAVAEVNGIDNFRDIKPGQKLHFPPLS